MFVALVLNVGITLVSLKYQSVITSMYWLPIVVLEMVPLYLLRQSLVVQMLGRSGVYVWVVSCAACVGAFDVDDVGSHVGPVNFAT